MVRLFPASRVHRPMGFVAVLVTLTACAPAALPDPRAAAADYKRALERNDADGVYAMLSADARRAHGRKGTARLVQDARKELVHNAESVSKPDARVEATAVLRYGDGEQVELALEDGRFRIAAAGTLPAGARTPSQALAELRRALARRSYSGLLRVLSTERQGAVENDMRSLVEGLEQPETLDVKVSGDRAEVRVPGGHRVVLKRESGVWRVEDFD